MWNYLHCYYICETIYTAIISVKRFTLLLYLWNDLLCYYICETIYSVIISAKSIYTAIISVKSIYSQKKKRDK